MIKRPRGRLGWFARLQSAAMKKRKGLLVLMTLAACSLTFTYLTVGQSQIPFAEKPPQTDAAIPDQFRSLYRELDETLRQDRQLYPFKKGNSRPLVASNLLWASSIFGPAASDS